MILGRSWIDQIVAETDTGIEGVVKYVDLFNIVTFVPLKGSVYWDAPRWIRTYKELYLLHRLAKQYEAEQARALAEEDS